MYKNTKCYKIDRKESKNIFVYVMYSVYKREYSFKKKIVILYLQ